MVNRQSSEVWQDCLRYGHTRLIDECITSDGHFITYRIISYDGHMYWHKMIDGQCVACMIIDELPWASKYDINEKGKM